MKQVKRILRENTTVDTQTGEVLQRETTVQFSKEPAYVKLYFDCLGTYIKNDGLSESCNDLLVEVLKRTSYAEDGQVVHLDSYTREQICKATHKSLARLKQAITTWTKNKVLIRVARGVYQVNPYIFGRGEWRDIANLRATFNFSKGSVTVTREYEEGHREARIDIETGTCITNPNPSQTHENALEGASDVKQVSSTRTQPNRVQRANASGNNLPTKFEAARSRFFVGRDGVSHPRNADNLILCGFPSFSCYVL